MIKIKIRINSKGFLEYFKAEGHALLNRNDKDIVCAAVTSILRTLINLLNDESGVTISGKADKPGKLSMIIIKYDNAKVERLIAVSDFVIKGLTDISKEYPDNVKIDIKG